MSRFEELLQVLLNGESVDIEPESRIEAILKNAIEGKGLEGLGEPQSRSEAYLMAVAEKGVGGGETVEKIIQALTITENGTYEVPDGVDGFGPVTVEIPKEEPVIQGLVVTENGTYNAPEGVDGYSEVSVNVPDVPAVTETLTVTENGTYEAPEGVDGYSQVSVNVTIPKITTIQTWTPSSSASTQTVSLVNNNNWIRLTDPSGYVYIIKPGVSNQYPALCHCYSSSRNISAVIKVYVDGDNVTITFTNAMYSLVYYLSKIEEISIP